MKAKTVGKALADVEAEALLGTFPDTLSEVVNRQMRKHLPVWRPRHRTKQKLTLLQDCRKHSCRHTLIEVKAKAVISTFQHLPAKIVKDTH